MTATVYPNSCQQQLRVADIPTQKYKNVQMIVRIEYKSITKRIFTDKYIIIIYKVILKAI